MGLGYRPSFMTLQISDDYPTGGGNTALLVTFQFQCRDTVWLKAAIVGALATLGYVDNWQQIGLIDQNEAADAGAEVLESLRVFDMIGMIFSYIGADLIPSSMLICDGATHNRDDYPQLWLRLPAYLIDIAAGTFRTPDLRGRVIIGSGQGTGLSNRTVGDILGAETHTLTEGQIPAHSHSYTPPVINVDIEAPGVPDPVGAGLGFVQQTGNTGGGNSHNNMQPSGVLVYVILAR